MKEAAYKGMVRQILEYGSSVWDPHTGKLQEELEIARQCLLPESLFMKLGV